MDNICKQLNAEIPHILQATTNFSAYHDLISALNDSPSCCDANLAAEFMSLPDALRTYLLFSSSLWMVASDSSIQEPIKSTYLECCRGMWRLLTHMLCHESVAKYILRELECSIQEDGVCIGYVAAMLDLDECNIEGLAWIVVACLDIHSRALGIGKQVPRAIFKASGVHPGNYKFTMYDQIAIPTARKSIAAKQIVSRRF